jgi:hypothetical protein
VPRLRNGSSKIRGEQNCIYGHVPQNRNVAKFEKIVIVYEEEDLYRTKEGFEYRGEYQ